MASVLTSFSLAACSADAQPAAEPASPRPASPAAQLEAEFDSPEAQLEAEFYSLVHGFEQADIDVFADPSLDAASAFEPYLGGEAFTMRTKDVATFRAKGQVVHEQSFDIHGIEIASLDLTANPATATVHACRSVAYTVPLPPGSRWTWKIPARYLSGRRSRPATTWPGCCTN